MISQVEPQKIVERLNNILYKNINIFNIKGTIIASNDVSRIGEYHAAAAECITSGAVIAISEENKQLYPSCKEGINLPVVYEGKVIGAVGITGDPAQVRGYGLIVKELIEHIYYENAIKSSDALYQEMVKVFFFELFQAKAEEVNKEYWQELDRKAKALRIDYRDCSLVACIFDNPQSLIGPRAYIRQHVGYCFSLYDNRLLAVARKTFMLDKKLVDLQQEIAKKFGASVKFLYTAPCKKLVDYPIQYTLIRSMSRFKRIKQGDKVVYSTDQLQEFFLLENLDLEYRKGYMSLYGTVFRGGDSSQTSGKAQKPASWALLQTVKSYFENDLSIKATALDLSVHRNTVVYRLQQFVDTYGIDVFSATQCMRLYLAILMYEMDYGESALPHA